MSAAAQEPNTAADVILSVRKLCCSFRERGVGGSTLDVLRGIDLELRRGEILGVLGESGCGKTTLARCIVRFTEPTSGEILHHGINLASLRSSQLREARRRIQMVFQNPGAALNPRMSVGAMLDEPLRLTGLTDPTQRRQRAVEVLEAVGLDTSALERYPHAFSGGERQRLVIARALCLEPELIIADEPVSSLDISVRARVLNLLLKLRDELGLTLMVIAHDIHMLAHIADRIAVMYAGRIVELGDCRDVLENPQHPYSSALIAASPDIHTWGLPPILEGEPPSPAALPSGCSFHPRCAKADAKCRQEDPRAIWYGERCVACHAVAQT